MYLHYTVVLVINWLVPVQSLLKGYMMLATEHLLNSVQFWALEDEGKKGSLAKV